MRKNNNNAAIIIKLIVILFLLLIYGFTYAQYLIKVDKYKKSMNVSTSLHNQLSEYKIRFNELNDLKTIREKAINNLHMRYAKESEKMILEND